MTYQNAIDYLFSQLPVFQRDGASAYKPGLDTSIALARAFGDPQKRYPTIHIAGTNGKGSTAHTLAAIIHRAGYRTGLYTSPHIFDFRERIRVDGAMIPEGEVVSFTQRWIAMESPLRPSFFELTSTMAFDFFARAGVDVAVIETGLGGRLDSTNIITPALSVITNISLDHTAQLGHTRPEIAAEKAGIIKPGVPAVLGEYDDEILPVFRDKARSAGAPLVCVSPLEWETRDGRNHYPSTPFGPLDGDLSGEWQACNMATILAAVAQLRSAGFAIPDEAVAAGVANVTADTGLLGRWTVVARDPVTVIDTGHNIGGWTHIVRRLSAYRAGRVRLVCGFVADKDIAPILRLIAAMPEVPRLYFSAPSSPRGLRADRLAAAAREAGLDGTVEPDVNRAVREAREASAQGDLVVVAGSNFLIADLRRPV